SHQCIWFSPLSDINFCSFSSVFSPKSKLIKITRIGAFSSAKYGNSFTQGLHHVAQKFITTGCSFSACNNESTGEKSMRRTIGDWAQRPPSISTKTGTRNRITDISPDIVYITGLEPLL